MKFLLSWLKEFIELSLPPASLADRLTLAGLEVTSLSSIDGDWLFEAEVTPNRPDLLSHLGLARETAATLGRPFRFPRRIQKEFQWPAVSGESVSIRVENPDLCPLYVGVVVEGVQIAPSSLEMTRRLNRLGIRPINNVVDITNLCLMELGQPLHAFDLDRLEGSSIVVRKARTGEKLETLDGVPRVLSPELLVIADSRKPVALAGVMGGKNTEITASTRRIFLESACFKSAWIRRATRLTKLSSDSSYRFERGVDLEMVPAAAIRAARWIARTAGGTIRAHVRAQTEPPVRRPIVLKPRKAEDLLGIRITAVQQRRHLERLGCSVRGNGRAWRVEPPSWRNDLRIPEDLYEELARLFGYDRCPASLPAFPRQTLEKWEPLEDPRLEREREIREWLVSAGCQEILTYSLLSPEAIRRCEMKPGLSLRNALSAELSCLRPSLMAGALGTLSLNVRKKSAETFLFFEIGKTFGESGASSERKSLSILAAGVPEPFFRIKGIVQMLCDRGGWKPFFEKEEQAPACQPETAMGFYQGNNRWGGAGLVSRKALSAFEISIEGPVAYAEFDLDKILETAPAPLRVKAPPRFPAVERDLALVVPETVTHRQLLEVILQAGRPLLKEASLFDLYQGKQVSVGKKSLAFRLIFLDPERTLTEEEVTGVVDQILKSTQERFQATLRALQ